MIDEDLWLRALRNTRESVGIYGLDGTVLYINPETETILGKTLDELRGKKLFDELIDAAASPLYEAFQRVAAGGAAERFDHYHPAFDRWFVNDVVRDGDRVFVYGRDTTEDRRRQRRLETLARISEILTSDELDMRETAQSVADILSEVLDSDCTLALLSKDLEWLEVVARASRDPETRQLAASVQRWSAHLGNAAVALRTRTTVLAHRETTAQRIAPVQDATLREVARQYEPTSVLVVPLFEGDTPIGVLIASRRKDARPLTEDDRALAAAIGPSVGLYLALAARRVEAESARSRLSVLADSFSSLVSFVDHEERYQYVNAAYEQWFGGPRERFLGRTVREALGDAYATVEPYVRQALTGTPVRFRSRLPYPSGARHVDAQYVPIKNADGDVEGFAVLIHDITNEARLAQLEQEQHAAQHRLTQRLESLLVVTGQLAGVSRREDIARVLVDRGVDGLHCQLAGLWIMSADGRTLELVRQSGFLPQHAAAFQRVDPAQHGPLTECVTTGRPVWVSSRAEYAERYPEFEQMHRPAPALPISFANLPLSIEGRVIGCLNFTFHEDRTLSTDERTYLEVLASHGSEALRRARIYADLIDVSETRDAMIQASPAAIMLLDGEGVVHAWNRAAERIFGWTASDVLGKVLPALGDRIEDFKQNLKHVLSGNELHGRQARRQRANGESFDAELYAAPAKLSDGRSLCLSIVVDITERKRVERGRQLVGEVSAIFARSLELQKTLGELVRLPLKFELANWCCVDLLADNDTLERIALARDEFAPGIVVPRQVRHDPQHPGSSEAIATRAPQVYRDVEDALLQRSARDEAHLAVLRALRMRSMMSVPLLVGDRVLGALTFASLTRNFDELDISIATEVASSAAIAIDNARLFEEVRKARNEAEDASRAKDQFLAMLGHELRNPLAPLVTALELMDMRAPQTLERERAVIQRQVEHLSRLVDDLLDVSRITRGNIELRREPIGLGAAISRAIEQTSPLLEERLHRLLVDVDPHLFVHGDATRLAQIVANLLSNAAKYTRPGGEIQVRGKRDGAHAVLVVRDNGVGIRPDMLACVFEPFMQAPQPSARPQGGLGLGLTIVRRLVELHGGSVHVHSDGDERGAEFTVRLALVEAPAKTTDDAQAPRQQVERINRRKILLVDDNEDAAQMLAELLEDHGHEIRTAGDGPTALRIADDFRPDVAVLDIGLPVMDGYELASRLRSSPQFQALRLIALTGYGQESDRARALDAGFHAHLAKPIRLEALMSLLCEPS